MTKKNIWVKLLIVALIIAMVSVVFVACDNNKNKDKNQGGNNNQGGGTETEGETDEAVNALLGVIDDAIVALSSIDNVGNLGTDAYIDLAMEQNGKTQKIRIDLDLSLDLLDDAHGGNGYAFNGFGFTVSVDEGDGKLDRAFGVWYVDTLKEADSYIYLSAGGQNFKIDGLTLQSVLEKYAVNANVEVGNKLKDFGSLAENPSVSGILAMLPTLGINIGYEKVGNQEVFSLNLKELLNPASALGETLDGMVFGTKEVTDILSALGLAVNSVGDLYNVIPNIDLEVIGNYDANGTFESIGLGLAVAGKSDGVTLPTTDGKGLAIVEGAFPDTNLSATLGFKILSAGDEAYNNVADSIPAGASDWNNIGALNFAVAGQVTLGKTSEDAKTYDVEISADINLAAVANATFVKKLYYTDENGVATSKDWFYLKGQGPFSKDTDKDIIDVLLPAINSLYVKMVNVKDSSDILLINLDKKITTNAAGDFTGGQMTIKLAALTDILNTFGVKLDSTVSNMISSLEGTLPIGDVLGAIKPVLSGFIYKSVPEGATTTAPAADALNMAEATDDKENTEGSSDVMTIIVEVIQKVMACVNINTETGSITAAADKEDNYSIGGAAITFDMVASLLKDADNEVNGVELKFNKPLVLDYNVEIKEGEGDNAVTIGTDKVLTTINVPSLKIGGTGNLFSATVSVTQDKDKTYTNPDDDHKNASSELAVYIGIDLEKIGYGCATRTPVVLDSSNNPTSSIFTEIGWFASKTAE